MHGKNRKGTFYHVGNLSGSGDMVLEGHRWSLYRTFKYEYFYLIFYAEH